MKTPGTGLFAAAVLLAATAAAWADSTTPTTSVTPEQGIPRNGTTVTGGVGALGGQGTSVGSGFNPLNRIHRETRGGVGAVSSDSDGPAGPLPATGRRLNGRVYGAEDRTFIGLDGPERVRGTGAGFWNGSNDGLTGLVSNNANLLSQLGGGNNTYIAGLIHADVPSAQYASQPAWQGALTAASPSLPAAASLPVAVALTPADPKVVQLRGEVDGYIAAYPEQPAPYAVRAYVEEQTGDYPAAARSYRQALALGQDDPATWTRYAGASHRNGDYPEAVRASKRALALDPDDKAAQAVLALSRGRVAQMRLPEVGKTPIPREEGVSAPRWSAASVGGLPGAAAAGTPVKAQAAVRAAAASLQVQDYPAARRPASRAVELGPENAQAYYLRAAAAVKQREYAAAVSDLDRAQALAPDNRPILLARAWALNRLARYGEAQAASETVLRRDRDDPLALVNLAYALAGQGRRPQALGSLERAARVKPAWAPLYDRAQASPRAEDLLLLFDDEMLGPVKAPAPPARPSLPWKLPAALGLLLAGAFLARLAAGSRAAGPGRPSFWEQYRRLGELGAGGMGVVYDALDLALDRRVAVKRMREEIRRDPRERERFLSEARLVAGLKHPSIVEIYSIHAEEDSLFLVFERVPGKTLSALIAERGPLAPREAARVLEEAARAVEYAHGRGVIHRDLKPSNIMVTEEGAVKVMDFGIARRAKEALSRLTASTVSGTPPYMAPEQEQGSVRKESDVFALGVCLYEMLTGELPYAGRGAGMLMEKLEGRWTPLARRLPGCPEALEGVLARALAPDPARRWASAAEFASAARRAAEEGYPAKPSRNSSISFGSASA